MKNIWLIVVLLFAPVILWAGGSQEGKRNEKAIETETPEKSTEESKKEPQLIDMILNGDDQAFEKALKVDFDVNYIDDNGRSALHAAAEKGNVNAVNKLVNRVSNVDLEDNDGKTPLLIAVENGHTSVVSVLMDSNADPKKQDKAGMSPAVLALNKSEEIIRQVLRGNTVNSMRIDGTTLLHLAAAEGNIEKIKMLLELGALPETPNDKGELALDSALVTDNILHAKSAALLLQEGSPGSMLPGWGYITEPLRTGIYDIRFDYGSTALHLSLDNGHKGMTEYLIKAGADVNLQDEPGRTPLQIAVGKGNLSLSRLLIENDADINIPDITGNTPLHISLNLPDPKKIITLLLDKGANPNTKNAQGHTPLHYLVLLSSDTEIAEILLNKGANLDPRDNEGNTPLLLALENKTGDTVDENTKNLAELFLSKGADIYAKNHLGITPVISALRSSSTSWFFIDEHLVKKDNEGKMVLHHIMINKIPIEELKTILATNIDPDMQDYYGNTALHYAMQKGLLEHARLLSEAGGDLFRLNNAKLSPLVQLFKSGSDMTLSLLSNSIDIEDEQGSTPLFFAIETENEQLVSALIANGADINHANRKGITALHKAVQSNNKNIVKILLDNKADPNIGDSMGRTPLHDAIVWNHLSMAIMLSKQGANMNARDKAGLTGLHLAVQKGASREVCRQLIALGGSVNTRDNNGRTPLFFAAVKGKKDIVRLLVSNGVYLDSRDNEGQTPLLFALRSNTHEGALSLINEGADIFAADYSGSTPFDLIMENEVAGHLLVIPEIVNRQDNNGNTPLHLAIHANAPPEFISLLVTQGADKSIQNSRRQTPLQLARTKGKTNLLDILK